jgi:hypothetical protein
MGEGKEGRAADVPIIMKACVWMEQGRKMGGKMRGAVGAAVRRREGREEGRGS